MQQELEFLEKTTGDEPTGTVIWLHGLGADATDFEPVVPLLGLSTPLKFIFPNAPERPITINGGASMRGWYDVDPSNPDGAIEDIEESSDLIYQLIQAELDQRTPSERVTVANPSASWNISNQGNSCLNF